MTGVGGGGASFLTHFAAKISWPIRVSDPHFFFADPDLDPGKDLHADPDPDPGGIRGRGLVVKGKMNFF